MFQLFVFQPLKHMLVFSLLTKKQIAFGEQTCIRNIRQKIETYLMIPQTVDIFFEKTLIEPERTNDSGGNIQFFFYFPNDRLLCRFSQCDTTAAQSEIRRPLVLHRQDFPVIQNDRTHSVIEFLIPGFKRNIHFFPSHSKQTVNKNRQAPHGACRFLVPLTGLEPVWCFHLAILSRLCLPIPP